MKRFLPLLILAAATILTAQAPNQRRFARRVATASSPITHVEGQTFFAADDVMAALGGSVPRMARASRPRSTTTSRRSVPTAVSVSFATS